MSKKILQINLRFNVSAAEMEKEFSTAANPIAAVPGLNWKIWLMNEREKEAGGIYLFEDDQSLKSYIEGPIVAGLKANKAVSNISVKSFDIAEGPTGVTRGPIK